MRDEVVPKSFQTARLSSRLRPDNQHMPITSKSGSLPASVDARIAAALARGHHVASEHVLLSSGVSRRSVRRRLRMEMLHEVLPRTYAFVAAEELSLTARASAAVLSLQRHRAAISHESAARLLGLWDRGSAELVHVLSETQWRPSSASWVRYHSTRNLPGSHVVIVDGIACTNVVRTCVDLGTRLTPWQLARVLHEAEFRHGLRLDLVEAMNDVRHRAPGSAVVRLSVKLRRGGSAGTRSPLEDLLLALIIKAGLPVPLVCNPLATELTAFECDLVWPNARLVVEVDGIGHRRAGDVDRDRARDAALNAAGWTVIRVSGRELRKDPHAVVRRIAAALACRA
jgi:hypothetical protein